MSEEELNSLSCNDVGDLVGPSNFYYSEAAQKSQLTLENFECGRLYTVARVRATWQFSQEAQYLSLKNTIFGKKSNISVDATSFTTKVAIDLAKQHFQPKVGFPL